MGNIFPPDIGQMSQEVVSHSVPSLPATVIPGWGTQDAPVWPCHPAPAHAQRHGEYISKGSRAGAGGSVRQDEAHSPLQPQYLSCLTTSRSMTDKLAFDVGLQEDATGTAAGGSRECDGDTLKQGVGVQVCRTLGAGMGMLGGFGAGSPGVDGNILTGRWASTGGSLDKI